MQNVTLEILETAMDAVAHKHGARAAMVLEQTVMLAAWEHVKPEEDWKGPVKARVMPDLCHYSTDVLVAAVKFVTATEARVTPGEHAGAPFTIEAAGYRAGPAW